MFFPSMVPLPDFCAISVWHYLASEAVDLFAVREELRSRVHKPTWYHSSTPNLILHWVKFGYSWNLIIYLKTTAIPRLRQDKMVDLMAFVVSGKLLQGTGSSSSSQSGVATSIYIWVTTWVTNSENSKESFRSAQDQRRIL